MDWNRSKTIFIGVFLILNIFLYFQYLDSYNGEQQLEVLGKTTEIESRLKEDNITYSNLPTNIEVTSYYSGAIKNFKPSEVPYFANQRTEIIDDNKLVVTMEKPVKLKETTTKDSYTEFLHSYVHEGTSYILWKVDEEKRQATFFQKINNRTLYYNVRGYVQIYWDEEGRVFAYEQTILENHEKLENKKSILPPIQVLQILWGKNLLKPDSQVTSMNLGYSTLVQITQTQVFAPTWEVRVLTSDKTEEIHFVNAVDGKIVDIQNDLTEIDAVEEAEE
ncbi:transcriptional regulator [Solibacillus sp. R5-41]|uniref:two-component system regulatory protein YycI n=1 Tax=Solibacillus sp. R5-41 TaxID=2048654 RepID=UPI000C126BDC|nr:two-component system regulatory protein YycI [Solibacillus sp. R5-41]ATP42292.1 transcriptional regulator [Solibacillus sp. R5-41]